MKYNRFNSRMHKAKLSKKIPSRKLQCLACQRYCRIGLGKTGFCLTRKNLKGQLYTLNYGLTSGIQIDPIEKKPLYHFYPGSEVLSVGSFGCNFRCHQCQNWHCSWGELAVAKLKVEEKKDKEYISPENLVNLAIKNNCPGIAFTYNEPVITPEYVHDSAKLAKEKGLFTVFVSNGSWTPESLEYYGKFLDAANIDFKGWGELVYKTQGAFWGQLRENLVLAYKKYQIHLELTTLLIPEINDKAEDLKKIAFFIVKNLGPEIPWHLSRYSPDSSPDEKFRKIPATSRGILEKAYKIGKQTGLHHVYIWAPAAGKETDFFYQGDTVCPNCQKINIKRNGWQTNLQGVEKIKNKGICKFCKKDLYLIN